MKYWCLDTVAALRKKIMMLWYCVYQLNQLIYHPSNNYPLCILDMAKWSSWSSCTCEKQKRTRKCLQVSQNCHNFTTNESRECNSSFCKGKTSLDKVYLNKTMTFQDICNLFSTICKKYVKINTLISLLITYQNLYIPLRLIKLIYSILLLEGWIRSLIW